MRNFCLFIFILICPYRVLSQGALDKIEYSRLVKYKVDENRFELGRLGNAFSGIPCFRDYTKSSLETNIIDPEKDSIIYAFGSNEINGLKIIPNKISLNRRTGAFEISGQVTGAWENVMAWEFEIYIGHRVDTISNIVLAPSLEYTVFYNGKKLDSTIVVDVVPAFYLTNVSRFKVSLGDKNLPGSNYKEMVFNIKSMIDEKSVLIFGVSSRYVEIFEIGKLLTQ